MDAGTLLQYPLPLDSVTRHVSRSDTHTLSLSVASFSCKHWAKYETNPSAAYLLMVEYPTPSQ